MDHAFREEELREWAHGDLRLIKEALFKGQRSGEKLAAQDAFIRLCVRLGAGDLVD